ncbi:hypothetical protein CXF83_01235 [Shewanella sp. Choline-02u-19]|uniref:hypothetical protein n=1 Tax=unclassified Shewanella TaxID=196818 RepID=UPI000C34F203|nr:MULTISPECIES: hypothetical protein [unclassified Shewanella]PKG58646.1 hypothetical protein CXF82_03455 [Shewanella sp. GutDb-MelDb]PKG75516.1 hypothetical protein CXF86_06765 [Shewanella sp. GutCb]PKH63213.1 hypothetical protein CXF84_00280 [Shewanella sp. Bg11-22]PKI30733.1 hypothetical protein CXF83_01235 [Shewanella sp. Choline-02u-19]
MLKKAFVAVAVLTAITGCKSTGPNVCSASTRVELPVSSHVVKGTANTKVIIFEPDLKVDTRTAKSITASFHQSLSKQVDMTGSTIVDRSLATKLKSELQIAEASGRYSSEGVPIADFAIFTDIGVANFSREFSAAHESYDPIKDKRVMVAAACNFEAKIEASTRAVSLPDMITLDQIQFAGDSTYSFDTNNSRCPISQEQINSMIAEAAKYAVTRNDDLKNLLAPRASVVEMRQCDAGTMVRIDMGSRSGVEPEWEVDFITHEKVTNYAGEIEIETSGYGEGEVINNAEHGIKPDYAWVMIDKDMAGKVKRGDTVKVKFEDDCNEMGFLSSLCHKTSESMSKTFSF